MFVCRCLILATSLYGVSAWFIDGCIFSKNPVHHSFILRYHHLTLLWHLLSNNFTFFITFTYNYPFTCNPKLVLTLYKSCTTSPSSISVALLDHKHVGAFQFSPFNIDVDFAPIIFVFMSLIIPSIHTLNKQGDIKHSCLTPTSAS